MSGWVAVIFVFAGIVIAAVLLSRQHTPLEAGNIYSVDSGEGGYHIAKMLVHIEGISHIRLYKQKFKARPTTIDLTTLTLGTIHDPDGYGMGHMPLSDATFMKWDPVFITKTTVLPEELEGYEIWKKDSGGGVF